MAAPTISAVDYFAFPASFEIQSSGFSEEIRNPTARDAQGNDWCTDNAYLYKTGYSNSARYCQTVIDIGTDLSTLITTAGAVVGGVIPTSLTIKYNGGDFADVDIDGVVFAQNQPTTTSSANYASLIPALSGFGIPDMPGVVLGDGVSTVAMTINCMWELINDDTPGYNTIADCRGFYMEVDVEYSGVSTNMEATGFFIVDKGGEDPNSAFTKRTVKYRNSTPLTVF